MTATPTPGALARLLDVSDADLRALLVGAAVRLPDLTGLLIAADRAADADEQQIEHSLRLMHATATGPLDPCEGFARVTLLRLLNRTEFAPARAAVAGVTLGVLGGAFADMHPRAAALTLFAGAGVCGPAVLHWLDCDRGRAAVERAAATVADELALSHSPEGLHRAALTCGRWLERYYAAEGPNAAALLKRLGVNVFVGAVRDAAGATLEELRELRIGRRRLAGAVQGG